MSGAAEPWTVARLSAWATADFQKRGLESPRLSAELLLGEVLGRTRIALLTHPEHEPGAEELARFRALVRRRRSGEPVAYLLGTREFHGRPFRVDARVLVPRPDTEALVEVALERTRPRAQYGRLLDLCTGSGNVAITLARERPTWAVWAVDVSADALAVARENALRLGAVWGVAFVEGDLYAPLDPALRFDLITANPPYVPTAEVARLDPGVRDHEPRLALDGGEDGLTVLRRVVQGAPARLAAGGVLAVEIHWDQGGAVPTLLQAAGFAEVRVRRDYGGHERVVSGIWAG